MCDLDLLREQVSERLSPYRFAHTVGVAEAAAMLSRLYLPAKKEIAVAAALLHDITKELSEAEQRRILAANGVILRPDEDASPAIFHGMTAAILIPREYPAAATAELCGAVRWHTTGHAGMTLFEAILFLADYIEEGRPFADCRDARAFFLEARPEKMPPGARLMHLRETLLFVLARTLDSLRGRGAVISADTLYTYEWLKNEKNPFA